MSSLVSLAGSLGAAALALMARGPPVKVVEGVRGVLARCVDDRSALEAEVVAHLIQKLRADFARVRQASATAAGPADLEEPLAGVLEPVFAWAAGHGTDAYRSAAPGLKAAIWAPAFSWVLGGTRSRSLLGPALEDVDRLARIFARVERTSPPSTTRSGPGSAWDAALAMPWSSASPEESEMVVWVVE